MSVISPVNYYLQPTEKGSASDYVEAVLQRKPEQRRRLLSNTAVRVGLVVAAVCIIAGIPLAVAYHGQGAAPAVSMTNAIMLRPRDDLSTHLHKRGFLHFVGAAIAMGVGFTVSLGVAAIDNCIDAHWRKCAMQGSASVVIAALTLLAAGLVGGAKRDIEERGLLSDLLVGHDHGILAHLDDVAHDTLAHLKDHPILGLDGWKHISDDGTQHVIARHSNGTTTTAAYSIAQSKHVKSKRMTSHGYISWNEDDRVHVSALDFNLGNDYRAKYENKDHDAWVDLVGQASDEVVRLQAGDFASHHLAQMCIAPEDSQGNPVLAGLLYHDYIRGGQNVYFCDDQLGQRESNWAPTD